MKVVVLNGSPHKKGNTAAAISELVAGAREAGNEVEVVDLAGKKVAGCLGCKYCFTHDGVCVQKDDMADVLAALDAADAVIFASPIYWFDMTAQLKAAIDRMYARAVKGFHFHKAGMLLVAGADGESDFAAAKAQFHAMCGYLKWEELGIVTVGETSATPITDAENDERLTAAYELGLSINANGDAEGDDGEDAGESEA